MKQKSNTFETYAYFQNLDKSVIRLNPIIKKDGYKFVEISINELGSDFFNLIFLSHFVTGKREVNNEEVEGENGIRFSLISGLLSSNIFCLSDYQNKYVIFLKRIKEFKIFGSENYSESNNEMLTEMIHFKKYLIQKLRYFKNGDVYSPLSFNIEKRNRVVSLRNWFPRLASEKIFHIENDIEVKDFKRFYNKPLKNNPLIEIADASFNLAYGINNPKIKFITLMTALESLFNQSKDQISHTISRHLAIITSRNSTQFETNYRRYKELYDLRNSIVHGSSNIQANEHKIKSKKKVFNLSDENTELQNLVRTAINYCRDVDLNKKDFFDFLNAKGF